MSTIRWSIQAAADLEAVHDYIARDSEFYARSVCAEIVGAVDRLATFPQIGRMVPELQRVEIREVLVGSYRVVYKVPDAARVEILTIYHGARLLRLE